MNTEYAAFGKSNLNGCTRVALRAADACGAVEDLRDGGLTFENQHLNHLPTARVRQRLSSEAFMSA
jgi:hypothetical protein